MPASKVKTSTTYHSPDGNVSNESKRQTIYMQPNIVKKPLMTNYSREDSVEGVKPTADYNSPHPGYHQPDSNPRPISNRAQQPLSGSHQPQTVQAKRIKSATRHLSSVVVPTEISSSRQVGTNNDTLATQATVKKIKIKKRGHSENIHTDTSYQRNSQASNSLLLTGQHHSSG